MTTPDLLTLAGQFGPWGLFFGYVIWHDIRRDKTEKERADRLEALAKERIAADLALAHSLTLLEVAIKAKID